MPSWRSPAPVRQTISVWLALCAYEHHIFAPLSTHSPSSRRARVFSEATSEPESGSDIAIASTPPFDHAPEQVVLLLLGAEPVERADDDQRHAVAADRDLAARDLLEEQRRVEERAARAAVLLVDLSDHQPSSASCAASSSEWWSSCSRPRRDLLALGEVAQRRTKSCCSSVSAVGVR